MSNIKHNKTYHDNGNIHIESFTLNCKLHNENSPAFIEYYENGNIKCEEYYLNGNHLINISSIEELKLYIKLNNIL